MLFNKLNAAALSIDMLSNVKGGSKGGVVVPPHTGGTTGDGGSDYRKDDVTGGTTGDGGSDYGKIGKTGKKG